MSILILIFCDICNPQCIRSIEHRRGSDRDDRNGRRISDGRSWFEGSLTDAIEHKQWEVTDEGQHICPRCSKRNN